MSNKKYKLTEETKVVSGRILHRIMALTSFGDVDAGDLGGWVESENNLSHDDDAWVYGTAQVFGRALVSGNARVFGNAWVYGTAHVCDDALVYGTAQVFGRAWVFGAALVEKPCHVLTVESIGSCSDTINFFRAADAQIMVMCGFFRGTLAEFAKMLKKTPGDNKHAKAYALAIELARTQIEDVNEAEEE